MSQLPTSSAWRNSTLIRGNVVEEVRALKVQRGLNIVIDGSSVLVHSVNWQMKWAASDRILTIQWAVERAKGGQNFASPSRRSFEASP